MTLDHWKQQRETEDLCGNGNIRRVVAICYIKVLQRLTPMLLLCENWKICIDPEESWKTMRQILSHFSPAQVYHTLTISALLMKWIATALLRKVSKRTSYSTANEEKPGRSWGKFQDTTTCINLILILPIILLPFFLDSLSPSQIQHSCVTRETSTTFSSILTA